MNDVQSFWEKNRHKSPDDSSSINSLKIENFVTEAVQVSENKKRIACQKCLRNMKSKHNSAKSSGHAKKKAAAQRKFDDNFLDSLVASIEELKSRVHYFEKYFTSEVDRHKTKRKKVKQFDNISHMDENADVKSSKLSTYLKNFNSDKDNKYTVNPMLLSAISPERKKIESDSSLMKSSLSLTKNTYININPVLDSKHFKIAAQGFIKQAEELKNNISLILDNELSDNITVNDFENRMQCNCIGVRNEDMENGIEQHLEYLLGSVTNQYEEILKLLGSIQQQLKNVSRPNRKNTKLSLTSTKVSTYLPNNVYKMETFKNGTINVDCDFKFKNSKSQRKNNALKKLDPVVLVYEPIKPSDTSQEVCNYCGRGSTSCVFGSCRNHLVKSDGYEKKQDVCCGFMVSYTPNINQSDGITEASPSQNILSINSPVQKDYKKIKRKKNCLWF